MTDVPEPPFVEEGPPVEYYESTAPVSAHPDAATVRKAEQESRRNDVSHLPPQNLEAEEAILGAMILSMSAIEAAEAIGLRAEHFYRNTHRMVFEAVMAIRDAGETPDELTVIRKLQGTNVAKKKGEVALALTEVGGAARVMSFAERVPAVANAKAYAHEVVAQARRRRLVEVGHAVAGLGYDPTMETDELVAQAETMLLEVVVDQGTKHERGSAFDEDESLDRWAEQYQRRTDAEEYEKDTLSWGRPELDERLGRMEPGDVFVPAGWTKHGKTWWVMDVLEAVGKQGARSLLHSMEMNDLAVTHRFVAMQGFEHDKVRESRIPWGILRPIVDRLRKFKRRTVQGLTTVARIQSQVSRAKLEGRPYRVVAVDHLGLLRPPPGYRGGRREFVEDACAELKALAEEYEFTLILVSQLSRPPAIPGLSPDYKRPPVSGDLKEASGIEQIATSVIFVYRMMDKETGRQLDDRSGMLLFPFHRHRGQPRMLRTTFTIPSDKRPDGAYRFVPAEPVPAPEPTPEAQQALLDAQQSFGPGVTLVPDVDPDIPF